MNIKTKVFAVLGLAVFSLSLVTASVFAQQNNSSRPGWGWGDPNHTHTGPPGGPSVFPGPSVHPRIDVETEQTVEVDTNGTQVSVFIKIKTKITGFINGLFSHTTEFSTS